MLKIKEDVDLKILEKFGFEEFESCYTKYYLKKEWYEGYIKVLRNNNYIEVYTENDTKVITDTLWDLIKAGIVEKVSE